MNDTTETKPAEHPILVIQRKECLSMDRLNRLSRKLENALSNIGWIGIIVDDCDVSEVRAFGVPESKLEEFEKLKRVLEKQILKAKL